MDRLKSARELLRKHGQEHLLAYYGELSEAERESLLTQIESIDWNIFSEEARCHAPEGEIAPIAGMSTEEIEARQEEFFAAGKEIIRAGKVAALLLAGGQGTRLGYDGPKGTMDIGLTHPLYIFECLIRNLQEVCRACDAVVPLYIMTSDKTDERTRTFLKEHDYFGYPQEAVRFFLQDMAPATDFDGKILLEGKGRLALSPNGNGGCFSSLRRSGLWEEAAARGVEWFNVFAVDNVLQRIADPVFVGATALAGVNCGAKFVRKCDPHERVGVLCLRGGVPDVVEYYELSEEMANARDERGGLVYSFGVILNYLFRREALEEIERNVIPVHVAKKKIPCLNGAGELVKPDKENGCKYETLVVDIVRLTKSCLPYEAVREHEFAPIKNATGVDSVESARELLKQNGVTL